METDSGYNSMDLAVALGYRSGECFGTPGFHFRKTSYIVHAGVQTFFIVSRVKHYVILTPHICFNGVQSKQIPIKLNEFIHRTFLLIVTGGKVGSICKIFKHFFYKKWFLYQYCTLGSSLLWFCFGSALWPWWPVFAVQQVIESHLLKLLQNIKEWRSAQKMPSALLLTPRSF